MTLHLISAAFFSASAPPDLARPILICPGAVPHLFGRVAGVLQIVLPKLHQIEMEEATALT